MATPGPVNLKPVPQKAVLQQTNIQKDTSNVITQALSLPFRMSTTKRERHMKLWTSLIGAGSVSARHDTDTAWEVSIRAEESYLLFGPLVNREAYGAAKRQCWDDMPDRIKIYAYRHDTGPRLYVGVQAAQNAPISRKQRLPSCRHTVSYILGREASRMVGRILLARR